MVELLAALRGRFKVIVVNGLEKVSGEFWTEIKVCLSLDLG